PASPETPTLSLHDALPILAECALREDHQIDQRQHRCEFQGDQRRETDRKAGATDGPDPFAPDPVGKMPEPDLAGNAEQADDAERDRKSTRLNSSHRTISYA